MARKRITIIIEQEMDKKLRFLQSKMIREKNVFIRFSSVVENVLRAGLKAVEQLRDEKRRKRNG